METNHWAFNVTSYYDAGQLSGNLSINNSKGGPFECGKDIASSKNLVNFILCGVLLNLVGIFGVFGNAISMVILSRPQMKSSINYLLIGMATCDTALIVISVLIHGLLAIYPFTGLLFNYRFLVYPKIVRFLYPLSCIAQIATVYLTLIVTLERYIAVCHPLRARSFCTCGRARLAVIVIFIFSFVYNLPKFFEIDYEIEIHWKYNVPVYCIHSEPLRNNPLYITIYVHWMYFFICYLIPFLALVIFNMAIYKRVRKANRDLQLLSHHQRREIGLATMLFCVVIVFLICNILPLASNIYETFVDEPPQWLVDAGNLLVTINSSINFIIYVIFGRKFKRIFLKLFCSARILGPGRDSPECQTYDDSIVTNTTNVELRNSIRRDHLNRSSTICRNNNVSNGNTRQSSKKLIRPGSPGPCVYYPPRNPVNENGWGKKEVDTTL